ncbi:S9 family peptidase [Caulobacter sp. D4A]|uniref:alpha/beta hydrolase family protein n=1 Tax=unclassified Caulobacter TaxID=2648921 RepID=UPI000D73B6D0|nr:MULTISPECIES: S9 family peptidase [unclassified Caulobacter]PXA86422.1 S9 family peptidase [Caulobacter sp. D4A]PXA96682.1 S9 family peptidase [Caulobacter sp. D5]
MISRRGVVGGALGVPAILSAWSSVAAESAPVDGPPSLDELLKPSRVRSAALSPNGEKIALLALQDIDGKKIATVTFLKAADPSDGPKTIRIGSINVERIAWANDERLLIWINNNSVASFTSTGSRIGASFGGLSVRRILAINVGGGDEVVLFGNKRIKLRENFDLGYVVDMLRDDPRHVLMAVWEMTRDALGVYKVDVYTGEAELVEYGGATTRGWDVQDGRPVLRYDFNNRGSVLSLYGRPPGDDKWTFIRKIRRSEWEKMDFEVLGASPEPGVLLVANRLEDGEARILRKFDLRTLSFGETVSERLGRDLEDVLVDEKGRFFGARYTDDRVVYQFADPKMNAHYKAMNGFFGNEANVYLTGASADGQRLLAYVYGPRMPGSFFFYDKQAKRFEALGERQPWLTEARLAPMEALDVATRDGVKLRAYLTRPLKPGPHPLVVLPHGGPEIRDSVEYDLFVQSFAAQGWMVLQVNFRGSSGYGRAFVEAGRRRWGDRMQEDIEDAVDQVIKAGGVAPGKVAICGASYGGYAALMGAVRKPGLYKAAVSIAGVSDLLDMLAYEREDGDDSPSYKYWVETIGDPAKDRAMLEAASPVRNAAKVAVPVLLIHGADDWIVPARQSRIMAKALRDAGKSVQHVELRDIGHRNWDEAAFKAVLNPAIACLKTAFA